MVVVQVLTQQLAYQTARKYWNQLKGRLSKAGKNYLTDVATAVTLLRLVQIVPSHYLAGRCSAQSLLPSGSRR